MITLPDKDSQIKARGFLPRRLGRAVESGERVFPEAGVAALAEANIPSMVHGKASYEKQVAALRSAATGKFQ